MAAGVGGQPGAIGGNFTFGTVGFLHAGWLAQCLIASAGVCGQCPITC
jgi:hypothetical protein